MSTSLKAATGVLGVGTAAAGGTLAYKELTKPATHLIKDLLVTKNPRKRLIAKSEDGSSAEWKAAWKLYATSYKEHNKNPFSLTLAKPTETLDGSQNAPVEFMDKCESLVKERVLNEGDDKYQGVLQYCTRATLVSDLISENHPSKKVLSKTEAGSSAGWKRAWSSYKIYNTDKTKDKDTWKLSDWESQSGDDAPESFKTKCEEKVKVEAFELSNEDYLNAVKWCTQ
ncbi:hypothetical protein HF1_02550 [Mycoplasma haemofelis str. Langford 1]|uniref:Uncharacterized protein n=1 Tax=Mycoplasma haemofelis (strain Langford 1) TaxID=941640 RepID=E8ZKU7_MYCHL|nr:hypothetical protein [Mycoplasma haemofelis]CBY92263.1 hypothetical protein HF1_02550 [Mycoplasma haemofelis str. Langford 1]